MIDAALARAQVGSEIAHWRYAVDSLMDLDALASASAWAGLEEYLSTSLRSRLKGVVAGLGLEAAAVERAFVGQADTPRLRGRLLTLRTRYLQLETVVDFFGDALATRANPTTAALLRGLDVLAADSMSMVLGPLGIESPPALVYLDKGLGASILRAGVRLWDQANPSPVAAIELTRHNASHPTALFHETGHQVGHLTGWNGELAQALRHTLAPRSAALAETWESWANEVAADVYAFCLAGWAPLPALANVVDGRTAAVFRVIPGDPHPFPWIRVQFNAALCRSWLGAGPWDMVAAAWRGRHDPARAPREGAELARLSMAAMSDIVDVCTRMPLKAMGGRPVTALIDPRRASPAALDALARQAGASLLTSVYLQRRESMIAQRVGMAPAPRARELFDLAASMSFVLRLIEANVFAGAGTAALFYTPVTGSPFAEEMNRIVDLWQSATGERVKDRPIGTIAAGAQQPLRIPGAQPLTLARPALATGTGGRP